jgi:hypothetical protein
MIHGSNFFATVISHIAVEDGNRHFRAYGDFLSDFAEITVIQYFGHAKNVRLNRDIEILGVNVSLVASHYYHWHLNLDLNSLESDRLRSISANYCDPFVFLLQVTFIAINVSRLVAPSLHGRSTLDRDSIELKPTRFTAAHHSYQFVFTDTKISDIAIEDGNRHFRVRGEAGDTKDRNTCLKFSIPMQIWPG